MDVTYYSNERTEVGCDMKAPKTKPLKKKDIQPTSPAIKDAKWQAFRKSLKGLPTAEKLRKLKQWQRQNPGKKSAIQVTNYINALKRGGQLK